jgi:sugar phosphate isomerase/epimerase
MIRSSITISLIPEARGGPFVFWDDLDAGCAQAAELGFHAVELFAPSARVLEKLRAAEIVAKHGLKLAAAGTGGGWLVKKLSLTDEDAGGRRKARQFIREIIEWAAQSGAPAIVGSMQGRGADRQTALDRLGEGLEVSSARAAELGVPLIYEPLNRYETNLINRLGDGVEFLKGRKLNNVRLLPDLYHMNIEEQSIPTALMAAGKWIGHLHLVDSNRRAMGFGHTKAAPVAKALEKIGYQGYVSGEVLPWPDSLGAARQTMNCYNRYFRGAKP